MDNKFFQFVEDYKDDIMAFFEALKGFIQAVLAKLSGEEGEETEPTE